MPCSAPSARWCADSFVTEGGNRASVPIAVRLAQVGIHEVEGGGVRPYEEHGQGA